MSKSFGDGWKSEEVSVDKLWLDDMNPRLAISSGSTQDKIRAELIHREDVIDLAVKIATGQKLLAGERVIVTSEMGHIGVDCAKFEHREHPHSLLVKYDPGAVRGMELLRMVRKVDPVASMVGL